MTLILPGTARPTPVIRRWECHGCDRTLITRRVRTGIPFHTCRNGLSTPFVPEGQKCKVVTNGREDYVGKETVQINDDGKPVMNVVVERDDGVDCAVYAPCATAKVAGL